MIVGDALHEVVNLISANKTCISICICLLYVHTYALAHDVNTRIQTYIIIYKYRLSVYLSLFFYLTQRFGFFFLISFLLINNELGTAPLGNLKLYLRDTYTRRLYKTHTHEHVLYFIVRHVPTCSSTWCVHIAI